MPEEQTQGKRLWQTNKPQLSSPTEWVQTTQTQENGWVFLPWITTTDKFSVIKKNQEIKLPWINMDKYQQWIPSNNIKTNVVLPWITKPTSATMSDTTDKQKHDLYMDDIAWSPRSIDEQIRDERYSSQTMPVIKQRLRQTWDAMKKYGYRKAIDIVENPYKYMWDYVPWMKLHFQMMEYMWHIS